MTNSERLMAAIGPAFGSMEPRIDEERISRVSEALGPLIDASDFSCAMIASPDVARDFEGVDGILEAWSDWLVPYSELEFRIEDVREVGENVLIEAMQVGVTRHDGVAVEQPSGSVWKFRAGRLYRVEFHLDRRAAERSAREEQQQP